MPKWTEQQRDAIADRGHSLIVCAAAGSGKTAVLVERIVQLVREGCPIENMLVVTFTNAAAGEMRQRIGEALGKAAREDPALGEQVMAFSRASISHAAQVLRQPAARALSGAFHRPRLSHRRRAGVRRAQPSGDGGRDI